MMMSLQRKLLILDLDETLVHSADEPLQIPPDFTVGKFHVYKRPHLDYFLGFCLDRFELAIWSQGSTEYVLRVVRKILPDPGNLAFVWGGERCTFCTNPTMRQYYWVKDLRKIRRKGYRLEHVIFVDDTPRKLERSYGNLVQVKEFVGDVEDDELLHLAKYLDILADAHNIRTIEKRNWRKRLR